MEDKQLIEPSFDFTPEERESLENYKKNGCPGLLKTNESDAFQWFSLYMSGKTYKEIAKISNAKRDLILYFSEKGTWHEKRMDHYSSMSDAVLHKAMASKLEALDTMSTMVSALNKYYGGKFNNFLKNNDNSIIDNMDTKMLSQYHKVMESIDKILSPKNSEEEGGVPKINIYAGKKTVIESNKDGSIDVSEEDELQDEDVANALKNLAKLSRSRKK